MASSAVSQSSSPAEGPVVGGRSLGPSDWSGREDGVGDWRDVSGLGRDGGVMFSVWPGLALGIGLGPIPGGCWLPGTLGRLS